MKLNTQQLTVLELVGSKPGETITDLAITMGVQHYVITRATQKLEDRGLVIRHGDGRTTRVYTTRAGTELLAGLGSGRG
jgi:DNA-binding MarR family transcriptional regulator